MLGDREPHMSAGRIACGPKTYDHLDSRYDHAGMTNKSKGHGLQCPRVGQPGHCPLVPRAGLPLTLALSPGGEGSGRRLAWVSGPKPLRATEDRGPMASVLT